MQTKKQTERFFSIELKSKANLKNITITNGTPENIVIEGSLGELLQVGLTESVVLEVIGKNGVLTLDLSEADLKSILQGNQAHKGSSRPI